MVVSNSTDRLNGTVAALAIKAPCKAVATTNITLSGEQTVGLIPVVCDDRVLVTGQTDPIENGIYVVALSAWQRAADFDGNRDVVTGTLVTVLATTGQNFFYQVDSDDPVIDEDAINFLAANDPNVSFPIEQDEIDSGLTAGEIIDSFPFGNVRRYGATGDGVTDDTVNIQKGIDAIEQRAGGVLLFPSGTYFITAALTITETMQIRGESSSIFSPGASIIDNTSLTDDVEAFIVSGSSAAKADRTDRCVFEHLRILHEATASTTYAIRLDNAAYTKFNDVTIDCNLLGFGGVLYGDELATPVSASFAGVAHGLRIDDFTTYGVRTNSTGTTWFFHDCFVRSEVINATGAYFNKENCWIFGGQWGTTGAGGIPIHFFNTGAADIEGGGVFGTQFEIVAAAEYGIVVDGSTRAWRGLILDQLGANLSVSVVGHVVNFIRAKECKFIHPNIGNPTGGGSLVEFGATAENCEVICDFDAATAPVTVNGASSGCMKKVDTLVARTLVPSVTTAANLTVRLESGVTDLLGNFVPVHNGVGWNFLHQNLADDTAISITPPNTMGRVLIMNDDELSTWGEAFYDARGGAAFTTNLTELGSTTGAPGGVTDFEVTTGVLAGTTGNNLKVTFSAHTDGLVYVEARRGVSNLTILFKEDIFGV